MNVRDSVTISDHLFWLDSSNNSKHNEKVSQESHLISSPSMSEMFDVDVLEIRFGRHRDY